MLRYGLDWIEMDEDAINLSSQSKEESEYVAYVLSFLFCVGSTSSPSLLVSPYYLLFLILVLRQQSPSLTLRKVTFPLLIYVFLHVILLWVSKIPNLAEFLTPIFNNMPVVIGIEPSNWNLYISSISEGCIFLAFNVLCRFHVLSHREDESEGDNRTNMASPFFVRFFKNLFEFQTWEVYFYLWKKLSTSELTPFHENADIFPVFGVWILLYSLLFYDFALGVCLYCSNVGYFAPVFGVIDDICGTLHHLSIRLPTYQRLCSICELQIFRG